MNFNDRFAKNQEEDNKKFKVKRLLEKEQADRDDEYVHDDAFFRPKSLEKKTEGAGEGDKTAATDKTCSFVKCGPIGKLNTSLASISDKGNEPAT